MDHQYRRITDHCPDEQAVRCELAEMAAERAVERVFAHLGVDVNNPESVASFQDDLRFGRRLRKSSEHGTLAFIALVASAIGYALFLGITTSLHK